MAHRRRHTPTRARAQTHTTPPTPPQRPNACTVVRRWLPPHSQPNHSTASDSASSGPLLSPPPACLLQVPASLLAHPNNVLTSPPPPPSAEVLVSPLHLAMVRVQSGMSPSVASALTAAVKSAGALGPWNGAWAFALKVCRVASCTQRLNPFQTVCRACSSLRVKWRHGVCVSNILAQKFMCRMWGSSAARLRRGPWPGHFAQLFQPKYSGANDY
jgi:hypothetical protein